MPSPRGRKRRPERRSRERTADAPPLHPATQARDAAGATSGAQQALPSKSARFTGLMIAVITAFLSILLITDAVSNGATSVDGVTRIVAGALMVLIALVVGVLSVFPAQIARTVRRRGERSS
jgi:hypothetical protein